MSDIDYFVDEKSSKVLFILLTIMIVIKIIFFPNYVSSFLFGMMVGALWVTLGGKAR